MAKGDEAGLVNDNALRNLDTRFTDAPGEVSANLDVQQNGTTPDVARLIDTTAAPLTPAQRDHIKKHWLGTDAETWFPQVSQEARKEILRQGFLKATELSRDQNNKPIETQWLCTETNRIPGGFPPEERFEVAVLDGERQITVLLLCDRDPGKRGPSGYTNVLLPTFMIGAIKRLEESYWLTDHHPRIGKPVPTAKGGEVITADFSKPARGSQTPAQTPDPGSDQT